MILQPVNRPDWFLNRAFNFAVYRTVATQPLHLPADYFALPDFDQPFIRSASTSACPSHGLCDRAQTKTAPLRRRVRIQSCFEDQAAATALPLASGRSRRTIPPNVATA